MQILLGDEINDPIAIMYTYDSKQWSDHTKLYFKNVQDNGVKLLQDLRPL